MSRDFQPPKPTGFDPEARFHVSTHDKVHGAPSHFNNSSTVRVKKGTKGYSWHVRPSKAGTPAPAVGPGRYILVDVKADYLVCHPYGSPGAANYVFIAKPPKLRLSITTETMDDVNTDPGGITMTYSSAVFSGTGYQYNRRIATNTRNGQTEVQVYVPRYIVGDTIYASAADTGVIPPIAGAQAITLKDDNDDARIWVRKNDNTNAP